MLQSFRTRWACGIFWLFGSLPGISQTTFVVERVPESTPGEDTIFVAGSFNNWNPGDDAYRLLRRSDGSWAITLGGVEPPFEYKFTRGSWEHGEADKLGKPIENRSQLSGQAPITIASRIEGWEDLPGLLPRQVVRIKVLHIPANTPQDASLFVTGNFNSWQPGDPHYQLHEQQDGSWLVEVPVYSDTLEYKFSRGSWATVEGRESGRARFNRIITFTDDSHATVEVQIDSWEDLSGTAINAYTVFWLMAAIQGFLIMIAINTLEWPVPPANRLLSLLLLLFSAALLTRVVVYDRDIFQWQPKLLLAPDLLYFLYAPIFVLYIQRLLRSMPLVWDWKRWLTFVPFVIHLLVYAPLLVMNNGTFIYRAVDQSLHTFFEVIGGLGLLYNLIYWIYARRLINTYQYESDNKFSSGSNLTFLNTIMLLKAFCLMLWAGTYVIGFYGWATGEELTLITDRTTDVLWIGFSLTVFLLGYFAMREPDIFRLPASGVPEPSGEDRSQPLVIEPELEESIDPALRQRVEEVMRSDQPYLNPGLTLAELADLIGTNTHDLSRIINQGFKMNFNDFINSYRVEEFKEKVLQPGFRNHTLLAVALMVGFNSKTAFNRSFKKLTGQTPGEYFRTEWPDS
ncbi:MAG: helix-turn-helix domain-containing protein [Bacteroidia bacterium]|nr:helix-turn-helix domain-containing protein [Bacteroidia bacterium]